jgi:hypothetical protein
METLPIFSRVKIYGFFILILVVDGESSSRDWTEILQAAGAIISYSTSEADYVLYQYRPSDNKEFQAVTVSTEWVIQCLIHQSIISPDDDLYYTSWNN